MRSFHLRVADAVRPDFSARRAYYGSTLRRRAFELARATSALAFDGEDKTFAATLTFYASEEDTLAAEERQAPIRAELDAAFASFGGFRVRFDLVGVVLGAIRVNVPEVGAPSLIGVGRLDPPPPVPGQQTLFLARLRARDGTEALVHVGSAPPRDTWPDAEFLERAVVMHVDRGEAMP